jgi:hypothetical protein
VNRDDDDLEPTKTTGTLPASDLPTGSRVSVWNDGHGARRWVVHVQADGNDRDAVDAAAAIAVSVDADLAARFGPKRGRARAATSRDGD